MKITKKQIRDLDEGKTTVRELFPDVFEEKFTGWAKCDDDPKWMGYVIDGKIQYGIDYAGNWFSEETGWTYIGVDCDFDRPATHEEIESALKKEAIKRGFVEGVEIKELLGHNEGSFNINPKIAMTSKIEYFAERVFIGDLLIFIEGKWAEIIDQPKEMTVEQIQKELGHKIKIVE